MEGRLVLKNCSIFRSDGRVRDHMAVLVEGGKVTRVAPDAEIPIRPGDWEISCHNRLVMAGLVDSHCHLVGGQLLPLSGAYMLRTPLARFELQQRVDAAITPSEVEVLTMYGLAKAARSGVTMIVEHLACPSDVAGGMAAQTRAAEAVGVRIFNSHATNSYRGEASAQAAVDGNADAVRKNRHHALVRTALGIHGSFACEDDVLRRVGRLHEELGVGVHFHLAESEDDLTTTFARHGKRIVPRFETYGLLGSGSVAAYARAIDRNESERLARSRTMVALSPTLALASEPGGGGFESVLAAQNLIGLGTSGTSSLWSEATGAFLGVMQVARVGRLLDPDDAVSQFLVGGPAELCSMIYGAPSGTVDEGCLADLVVFDTVPADERPGSMSTHGLLELATSQVAWTIVNGRVVVREGQLLGPNYTELAAESAKVLQAIWKRAGVE